MCGGALRLAVLVHRSRPACLEPTPAPLVLETFFPHAGGHPGPSAGALARQCFTEQFHESLGRGLAVRLLCAVFLGDYAQDECRIYLDYLDYAVPYWYLSEGPKQSATEHRTCPLQHLNGNVLAQYWVLGKQGVEFARYVDTTRFKGDLYYIQNLVAAINSFAEKD